MQPLVAPFQDTSLVEVQFLVSTFVLCSLIGVERQFRQKSAGYRTHVLVGLGSCAFTLVSAYGFASVLGDEVNLDPSRIAAQIVSGIGFLGAGVIFKGDSAVRGLTTAATVWVSAAVGMACGAGMLSLGFALTALHLLTLFVVAPLVRRLPDPDRKSVLRVAYVDGSGILRDILRIATSLGFTNSIEETSRAKKGDRPLVLMNIRFHGKQSIRDLVPRIVELPGVERVAIGGDVDGDDDCA